MIASLLVHDACGKICFNITRSSASIKCISGKNYIEVELDANDAANIVHLLVDWLSEVDK